MSSTKLAATPNQLPMVPEQLDAQLAFCDKLSKSGLIPAALQGNPGNVLVVLLTGQELGLKPMQALRTIHVVEGKPTLSASLMAALCQTSAVCELFQIVEQTRTGCTVMAQRKGDPKPTEYTFDQEDAKDAGLIGKQNWRKYPKAMYLARAQTMAARGHFPDIVAGIYDPDELDDSPPANPVNMPNAPVMDPTTEASPVDNSKVTVDIPGPEPKATVADGPPGPTAEEEILANSKYKNALDFVKRIAEIKNVYEFHNWVKKHGVAINALPEASMLQVSKAMTDKKLKLQDAEDGEHDTQPAPEDENQDTNGNGYKPVEDLKEFGVLLRTHRKDLKVSQGEFGGKMGVSQSTIAKVESGVKVSDLIMEKIAEYMRGLAANQGLVRE